MFAGPGMARRQECGIHARQRDQLLEKHFRYVGSA
jgi:hypothetical protein